MANVTRLLQSNEGKNQSFAGLFLEELKFALFNGSVAFYDVYNPDCLQYFHQACRRTHDYYFPFSLTDFTVPVSQIAD